MIDEGALAPLIFDRPFGARSSAPSVSVVVVVWQINARLKRCLAGLAASPERDWELIVVGNGVDPTADVLGFVSAGLSGAVLGLAENSGPSRARNVATTRATGHLLLFLDDDAIPEPGWVRAHQAAHDNPIIKGVRGRVVPDRSPFLTRLARAYDLGDLPRRAVLNTEGNASINREALLAVGGFAPIFGHEGVELTLRLVDRFGPDSIRYDPAPVIRHDYVTSIREYLQKRFRHGRLIRRVGLRGVRMAAGVRARRSPGDVVMAPLRLLGVLAEVLGALWP